MRHRGCGFETGWAAQGLRLLGLLAWAPGLLAQSLLPVAGDPAAGRRLFEERGCLRCHSIWGNGGTLGPDFAIVGAGRSMQQLAGLFWNHTPRMMETVRSRGFEWPTFTETELADLISYVYYVKLFDEPGNPELGERWFTDKRCAQCHSVGGVGGRIGPPLDGYARYIAPLMLAEGMWNHGPAMQARQTAGGVPIPTFVGREMADIQAYIRRASTLRSRQIVFFQAPDAAKGARLFSSKGCDRCHGSAGRGTDVGPDLRMATSRLRVSEIAGVLWNHSFQMSEAIRARGFAFPQFQGTEMADVIAFLYYLRFYETDGDARAGRQVFESKGCVTCHAAPTGAVIGPDLAQSQVTKSALGLATAMWNHAPEMFDVTQSQRVEWPRFEGDEMRDLAAYLAALARRPR